MFTYATAKLTGKNKGKVDVFSLAASRELQSLVTSHLSFTSVQMRGARWPADAVHPFGICHAVFGADI